MLTPRSATLAAQYALEKADTGAKGDRLQKGMSPGSMIPCPMGTAKAGGGEGKCSSFPNWSCRN